MSEFLRLEFKGVCNAFIVPEKFRIIKYSKDLHHNEIPLIYSDSFKEEPWASNWDNIEEFDSDGVFLAVDEKSGEAIGYIISFKRKDFGYISVVAVKKDWQKCGVASALIKSALSYLLSLNLTVIKIDVKEKNIPAINLYKKLGFSLKEAL